MWFYRIHFVEQLTKMPLVQYQTYDEIQINFICFVQFDTVFELLNQTFKGTLFRVQLQQLFHEFWSEVIPTQNLQVRLIQI